MSTRTHSTRQPSRSRWFYSVASLILLALTLIGFRYFYLHLQAYPGRPLPPPARAIFLIHGVLMTVWMIFAVAQPLLVASNRKKLHRKLGMFGAGLAVGVVLTGYLIAIGATRGTPPEVVRYGLAPVPFLTVPLSSILAFTLFVGVGIANRHRSEIHRPAMLMASLAVVSAPIGRIPPLNSWYSGTIAEHWFSAFGSMLVLAVILLAVKCLLEKRFDRWFAMGLAALTVICVASSLIARTAGWERFATFLLG